MKIARPLGLLLALSVSTAAPAAQPAGCVDMFARNDVPWYSTDDFATDTDFGAVGFSRNDEDVIRVPNPDVTCILLRHPTKHLSIVFNHRRSNANAISYVSFKLYGMTQRTVPRTYMRELYRRGSWHRAAGVKLLDDLQKHNGLPTPDPGTITKYEAFYMLNAPGTIDAFDQQFGMLHGIPDGSDESSWEDRAGMRPSSGLDDLSKVGWLRHDLQRFVVTANANSAGDPPRIETSQLQYSTIVVSVANRLSDVKQRTIVFVTGN